MKEIEITYYRASLDDVKILTENRIAFLEEIQGNKTIEEIEILRENLTSYFQRSLKSGQFVAFIAQNGHEPIGFSGMTIMEIPPTFSNLTGQFGYILNMFTKQEYRGLGICGHLMSLLTEEAKALKLKKLSLNATTAGFPIYAKIGFHAPEWKEMVMDITD